MAFDGSRLIRIGPRLWSYKTADAIATVLAAGYFNQKGSALRLGDVVGCLVVSSIDGASEAVSAFRWLLVQSFTAGNPIVLDADDTPSALTLPQGIAAGQSATAPAIADGATITTADIETARVAPAAARTGVIMQAGTLPGQFCTVVNEAAAANTVTMAAAGTSNVSNGTSCVIAGLTCKMFRWDSVAARWFPTA